MDTLIPLINRLQDVTLSAGLPNVIDLPQIAVIGAQSSGKSSVLENIVGRDFLPRGTGIVTRRPLVLQLVHAKPGTAKTSSGQPAPAEEFGEFHHLPGKVFTDFGQIREEIIRDTDEKTRGDKGVSPLPIHLKIVSPNVLNLTLVDLPGMTKVPVGDQPSDIEAQIRNMCINYINRKNAIILAVTAANTDLANSDALNLARQVDPKGERTIGVLTKIDIMDKGTDVLDILAGKVVPLQLGYVPVVNRAQRDIDSAKSIRDALDFERRFFENHSSYSNRAQYCGTPFLTTKLNHILTHHIRVTMPELRAKIQQQLVIQRNRLTELGHSEHDASAMSSDAQGSNIILTLISDFCHEFRTILDGQSSSLPNKELSGGARISFVLHQIFATNVRVLDPFETIKDHDIRTLLYNTSGSSPNLFVSGQSFEILVRQQIERLTEPSLKCVGLVFNELTRILHAVEEKQRVFMRYPLLRTKFRSAYMNFLKTALEPTNRLVGDIIRAEASYINTAHPHFITGHRAMTIANQRLFGNRAPAPEQPAQQQPAQQQPAQQQPAQQPGQQGAQSAPALPTRPPPQYPAPQAPVSGTGAPAISNADFFGGIQGAEGTSVTANGTLVLNGPPAKLEATGAMSSREQLEIEVIKELVSSYFSIVRMTISDIVPKSIMLHLVNFTKDSLQGEMIAEVYRDNWVGSCLQEAPEIVQRRRDTLALVNALRKADEVLSTV
ncbi:dynamin GTPase [Fonticula alba]|uniref:Dynamin GTPase n=1 Tax=Fonticula alba TaxID=691883 RepID=A0A058YZP8_FONAL|nr:dynamin GTPase [Fonticula alba]KCV67351.1 dynamin GTPase [Fonticula alba]|eukprot:XP_009498240.1 dynamin GTPase [Fonticula alba]